MSHVWIKTNRDIDELHEYCSLLKRKYHRLVYTKTVDSVEGAC